MGTRMDKDIRESEDQEMELKMTIEVQILNVKICNLILL
jgi:hypothetical protein